MAEDGPINDDFMAMEMSAAIGNPNINRLMGQDIRGIPQLPPTSGSNLSGYDVKASKRSKKNPLLGGIFLGEQNDKSQTGNIAELLQQVNKKSKSTKHQNILLPGAGLQPLYGLASGAYAGEGSVAPRQPTGHQLAQQPLADGQQTQYGSGFTANIMRQPAPGAAKNPQGVSIGKAKRNSFFNADQQQEQQPQNASKSFSF